MKKTIVLILALVLALSLCACGPQEPEVIFEYEEYRHINEMLSYGDYQGAMWAVEELWRQNVPEDFTEPPTEPTKPQPTEEEMELIYQYRDIASGLNGYAEYGSISVYDEEIETYCHGNEALAYCYSKLQELASIDHWLQDSEYLHDRFSDAADYNWDRQSLLDGFIIIPDVKLSQTYTTTDNMGNVSTGGYTEWHYDPQGRLNYRYYEDELELITVLDRTGTHYLTYNEKGDVIQRRYGNENSTSALVDYVYDDNGHLAAWNYKDNNGEKSYAFTCDDQGRVIRADWNSEYYRYEVRYTYDEAGRLVREERITFDTNWQEVEYVDYVHSMDYTYDASGKLVSGAYREEDWRYGSPWDEENQKWDNNADNVNVISSETQNNYTFVCDAQGRILTATLIPGDRVAVYGEDAGEVYNTPSYSQRIIEYVYGDYYIYQPVQGQ